MSRLTIRTVRSPSDRRRFLAFPEQLFRHDARWVPPLAIEEEGLLGYKPHPFHRRNEVQTFLALRDEQVVGRIAAIDNREHNAQQQDRCGFFGFFECDDDPAAARTLLDAASGWLTERGKDRLRGPFGPSINYRAGILVGDDGRPPAFLMPYNPGYYDRLLTASGLSGVQDLFAYGAGRDHLTMILPRLLRAGRRVTERRGIRFHTLSRWGFRQQLEEFLTVVNCSLQGHWGFVPLAQEELDHLARGMSWLLRPELVLRAEMDGQTVGVALAIPDYGPTVQQMGGRLWPLGFARLWAARRSLKRFRVVAANVVPELRASGLGMAITAEILQAALAAGAEHVEFSWIAESNPLSYGTLESGGAKREKTYRVYERLIA